MADERHATPLPADMLLLKERMRRQKGPHSAAPPPAEEIQPRDAIAETEEDRLLDDAEASIRAPAPPGYSDLVVLVLYRPLAQVSVAALPWAGAIDHEALQAAIVCSPVGAPRAGAGTFERTLPAVVPLALEKEPRGEPALAIDMHADGVAALDSAAQRASRQVWLRLVRAAALPNAIAGTDLATAKAAAPALIEYRTNALVHAWHGVLGIAPPADVERERDAAAVRLLSTLRALLGEA